jgi:hypothetical protein
MGKAIGQNAEHPEAFLRKHAKEPVLPQREHQQQLSAYTCISGLSSKGLLSNLGLWQRHQQCHGQHALLQHVLLKRHPASMLL